MSYKTRLHRLENAKLDDGLLAFFFIDKQGANREGVMKTMWSQYVACGGNPKAIPAFLPSEQMTGFVECVTFEEFSMAVMNRSKNPADWQL